MLTAIISFTCSALPHSFSASQLHKRGNNWWSPRAWLPFTVPRVASRLA